ncbi:hypothetical protein [Stenotrophomonas maltophilia]|uniref:hypothetical protein n=1 Tax=Stenotrophomonas maltophilia TaxID=40324 RepID=UPI00240D89BC|nr:hypothetical protein [Stenotrophomonas maltophilia]MDG2509382.1 hypothetical protein [Stenotrophomonas maltophilia]
MAICAVIVRVSAVLPAFFKDSPWLVYVLAMLVYVSCSSNWLGSERTKKIAADSSEHTVAVTVDGKVQGGLILAGRFGDSYVFWDSGQKHALLVRADDVSRLEVARGSLAPAKSAQ